MTSRITVEALCADTVEVVVQEHVGENDDSQTSSILQNGDISIHIIHDDREVYIYERVKTNG